MILINIIKPTKVLKIGAYRPVRPVYTDHREKKEEEEMRAQVETVSSFLLFFFLLLPLLLPPWAAFLKRVASVPSGTVPVRALPDTRYQTKFLDLEAGCYW